MSDDPAPAASPKAADVRFPPPLIFLGFVLLGALVDRLLALPPVPTPWWLGLPLLGAGIALVAAAIGPFRKSGQDPRPWTPTDALLDSGLYRWSRNPMYLGMAVAAFGLALALTSMTAALLALAAAAVVGNTVIAREEAYLAARLGTSYLDYRRRVRRWF